MMLRSTARVLSLVLAVSAVATLLSCGGGTEIAPSEPVVDGGGQASVTLAARDLGATTQVVAGVSGVQSALTNAVAEVVTFGADGLARLANGQLPAQPIVLTGMSGTPVYCQGASSGCVGSLSCTNPPGGGGPATVECDFWAEDLGAGLLQARLGGQVPLAPTTVLASYQYNARLLSVNVGITFPDGQALQLDIFNVPEGATAPFAATTVAASAPAPPDVAFNATLLTNLTTAALRQTFTAVDDPANRVTLTSLDLTNEASPCVAGDFTIMVRSDADPALVVLDGSFEASSC